MADTFDPSKKATNAILSNGNLTVTTGPITAYSAALTVNATTAGKRYAEFTINSGGGTNFAIAFGVANASASLTNIPGGDANGVGMDCYATPTFYYNNTTAGGGAFGTIANGSRLDICVDFSVQDVWIRGPSGNWNGDTSGSNPATGFRGLRAMAYSGMGALFSSSLYLMASVYNSSQGTLNVGNTAFAGAVPSGFVAWDPLASGAGSVQARVLVMA